MFNLLAIATMAEIWVHPSSSLQAAADSAAASTGIVHLKAGVHGLRRPLRLDSRHSGMKFIGHGASVSGGFTVTGWEVIGERAGRQIWRAATPKGADSRQFYVNGVRANRTWTAFPLGASTANNGTEIILPGGLLGGWTHNASAIELVYRGLSGGAQWQESRCPVASIAAGAIGGNDVRSLGFEPATFASQICARRGTHAEC